MNIDFNTEISKCKLNGMPSENDSFILKRNFSKQEMEILKQGHIAREMEDKWCGYFEDGKLYIHRSWTKHCIYILKFNEANNYHEVIVNRDKKQYLCTDISKDISAINLILNSWIWRKYE